LPEETCKWKQSWMICPRLFCSSFLITC
jgi:hypothetical protein